MKKGMFGKFARRLAACAMTASLAALSFPLSAFAAGNAKLSLRHFTAGSGVAVQGDASVQVFLSSAPGTYSLERNGEKQEIRFATLSDAVRAQYGVDSAYVSYATVNLYGNDAAKIDGLADGTSYFVKEDTENLSSVYAREPYYFGNQGSVSGYAETEAVSVDHRTGETPVVIRKTWDDSNNVSARPTEIKVRFDALDAEQNVIPGKSRIATVRPNADGQWYFVEGLHQLEKATDANAVRASRSNAQLASASEAEREGEVQSVHAYRLSEVLSGGNYVLRFPAASRIRAVGQDMNFDLVNSYYFSSGSGSSGGGSFLRSRSRCPSSLPEKRRDLSRLFKSTIKFDENAAGHRGPAAFFRASSAIGRYGMNLRACAKIKAEKCLSASERRAEMRRDRRKVSVTALGLMLAIGALTACGGKQAESQTTASAEITQAAESTAAATDGTAETANPWIDVRDLKEALKETGVELKAPEEIGDFHLSHVQVIQDGGIVQVFYGSLADQTETQALLRKAKSMEDISGDYTVYPEDRRVNETEGEVRLRGQDGRVYLATWQRGDYAYSLSLAQGMEEAKVMEVIAEIQ